MVETIVGDMSERASIQSISRSLAPLREVVASLSLAADAGLPTGSDRRRLVRRVRAAGVAAVPALLRALGSPRPGEAMWASYLLSRLGGPRVVERLSRLIEDPRCAEETRLRASRLLADLSAPSLREILDEKRARDACERRARSRTPRRTQPRPSRSRRDVFDLVEGGHYLRARPPLERAVALDPEDAEALSYLGVCLLHLGKPALAIGYLERAVVLQPDEALHHWNLGAAARAAERACRAWVAFARYLELEDDFAGAPERRRDAARFAGEYEKLISATYPGVAFDDVVAGEELFQAALTALEAARFDEAAAGFRRVLSLLPHHHPSWGNLGAAELGLDHFDEAARCFRKALALRPDYEIARDNLRILETLH